MVSHFLAAYLSLNSILMTAILIAIMIITNNQYVEYDQELIIIAGIFTVINILVLFYVLLVYNKIFVNFDTQLYKLFASCTSIFLIYFGMITLHVDEIKDLDITSVMYNTVNENNDIVSVLSILIGTFTFVMTVMI